MRVVLALALPILGVAGLSAASAADLPVTRSPYTTGYVGGVRAASIVIYDDEPGVYVRAYWRAPWRNRHYFPLTGQRPKVGRHERLSAVRPVPKPAASFYREWSASSDLVVPVAPYGPEAPPAPPQTPYLGK